MDPTEFGMMDYTNETDDAADRKLFVVFHRGFVVNEAKSTEAGRPIHDDVDLITIRVPGQRDSVVHRVDFTHQQRFPRQWAAFKLNAEQLSSGTQLSEVPWLTPAQIADLRASNIHTVEQLAEMSDANAHVFMGFHGLKQRAQAYLDAANGAAPALKLQAELDKRDAEINELKAIVGRLVDEKKAQTNAKVSPKKTHATDLV